ncbi:ATP-binding cassette sub-family A member 3 [Eumeta japonica]|uniref:ATP-binding cassette sub-family A member 3 n=1 Tax=Eumeta variegata TaxID=151549 RepID=A0A4C1WV02_EUMVA|nr:ATP-binding cassette sub-family A member 3 [Eumeta japonica]
MTTHFMDEADVLGDRVAIMAHGQLQCVGSPYFLKRHYGVGYTLVVVKGELFDEGQCTDLIRKYITDVRVKEDRGSEVTYDLPNEYSHCFANILTDLEAKINDINFKDYGLTATTLEDVFMRVGSDCDFTKSISENDNVTVSTDTLSEDVMNYDIERGSQEYLEIKHDAVKGFRLLCQQFIAVCLKLFLVWSRSPWLIAMHLLLPLLMTVITLGTLNLVTSLNSQVLSKQLTLNEGFSKTETLLAYEGVEEGLAARAAEAYAAPFADANSDEMTLQWVHTQTPGEYYLEKAQDPRVLGMRHSNLIGASFNDSAAVAWFSNFGYHDVAISVAGVHAALLRALVPDASLVVYNHPLEATYNEQRDEQSLSTMMSMQLSMGVGTSISLLSALFVMFYIKERIIRAKLLQKASGIQPALLWGSASVVDWAWFQVAGLGIIIACAAFQVDGLSTAQELGRLFLCLMVYGAAMLPLVYIFSYFFEKPSSGFTVLFFINVLFGVMGPQIVSMLDMMQLQNENVATIMDAILQFFPLYSFIVAITNLNDIGLTTYTCLSHCDYYSTLFELEECTMQAMCEYLSSCCRDETWIYCYTPEGKYESFMWVFKGDSQTNNIEAGEKLDEYPHFTWGEPGIAKSLTLMFISCVIFWTILMIVEYRLPQKIFNKKVEPPSLGNLSDEDDDVREEKRHAETIRFSNLYKHNLVSKKLTKYYGKNLAVNQVSFTVADDECFGLLGVNGAGKTSTFKMLMGDEKISSGDAFVQGHSVKTDIRKVHENIGYCPQFDAIFEELTGRETLQLFGLLRGLRLQLINARAVILAKKLGFIEHIDKRVHQYSGGNKRKLSTAIALLGSTRLVFLDEPTTGVDPAAKRQVWRAVRRTTRAGRGVVLTSHSMEECEALCSRLTIMVNGRFRCLGTPQHLKNKFSQGFTLTIKIGVDDSRSRSEQTDDVKNYVASNFHESKLMEEYQGLLTYYLSDSTLAWSQMFATMERARRVCNLEDYYIAQTTLEQIFLQFTKYQQTNNTVNAN